nr:hypothetical protein [Tanacetum cinerariifolium]
MRPLRAPTIGESSKQGQARGAKANGNLKAATKKNGRSSKQAEARGAIANSKSKAASSSSKGVVAKSKTATASMNTHLIRDEEALREVMQRPTTMSELHALKEAHEAHNAKQPSISEVVSIDVSQSKHPTMEF